MHSARRPAAFGALPKKSPPKNVVPLLIMDDILRHPARSILGSDTEDQLKAFPPWLPDQLGPREFLLPIPAINLVQLEDRFKRQTRLPVIVHSPDLTWDGARIEKTPPYWLRVTFSPQPFDPERFARHEATLAAEDKRIASVQEMLMICLAWPHTGLNLPLQMSFVTGSMTVGGEHIAVSVTARPGISNRCAQLTELRLFACSRSNLKEYTHLVVNENLE